MDDVYVTVWYIRVNNRKEQFATKETEIEAVIQLYKDYFKKKYKDKAFNFEGIERVAGVTVIDGKVEEEEKSIRKEVTAFADKMNKRLNENAHKDAVGWKHLGNFEVGYMECEECEKRTKHEVYKIEDSEEEYTAVCVHCKQAKHLGKA